MRILHAYHHYTDDEKEQYSAEQRQAAADAIHRSIEAFDLVQCFASQIQRAIKDEIWTKHRLSEVMPGKGYPPMALLDWIKTPHPNGGLGTTVGTVERILAACDDDGAKADWERAIRGQPGGEAALHNAPLDRLQKDWYQYGPPTRAAIVAWVTETHEREERSRRANEEAIARHRAMPPMPKKAPQAKRRASIPLKD